LDVVGIVYFEPDGIYVESNVDVSDLKYFKWWMQRNREADMFGAIGMFVAEICPDKADYSSEAVHPCGERPVLYFYDSGCFERFAVFMTLLAIGVSKSDALNILKGMSERDIDLIIGVLKSLAEKYEDIEEHREEIERELRSKIAERFS